MHNSRPADDTDPVANAPARREWRTRQIVIHVLQLFLGSQRLADEVRVEAAESEDKNTEQHRDKGAKHADPVLLENFPEDFCTAQILIIRVIPHFVIVDHDICEAHCCEQDDRQRQVEYKYVE